MARLIALLRGINVGGNKRVPMAELRELLAELGYRDVATYVQSGNAVFTAPARTDPARVEARISKALQGRFGFEVGVIVRTRDELAAVIAENPLKDVADNPSRHLVQFLSEAIDPRDLADLDPADFAPEAFHIGSRELHLWMPDGTVDSKAARALAERRLGVRATGRNWRTVEQLLALADGADRADPAES